MFQVSNARRVGFAGLLCARTELVYEQFGYFAAHFNAASNKLLANNDDDDGQKLYFNLWFAFHHVNCEYLFSSLSALNMQHNSNIVAIARKQRRLPTERNEEIHAEPK